MDMGCAEAGKQWRPPALSSLVNRLAQPSGMQPNPSPPPRPKPEEDQHYLDPSSDEEEPPPALDLEASGTGSGLSIYSAAAGPFRALLACIAAEPGALSQTLVKSNPCCKNAHGAANCAQAVVQQHAACASRGGRGRGGEAGEARGVTCVQHARKEGFTH